MQLQIDSGNGVPIYLQIVRQVRFLIGSGRLEPGSEVLPIRALAEQLLINPNTVARAYLELERSGLLVKRQGAGTYVAEAPPMVARGQRMKILAERIDGLLLEARQLGIELEEVLQLLESRAAKIHSLSK